MQIADALLLPAGRELDEVVAVEVMGWVKSRDLVFWLNDDGVSEWHCSIFEPSQDNDRAFEVEQRLFERGWLIVNERSEDGSRSVLFWRKHNGRVEGSQIERAETLPLAICRAALRVVEMEQETKGN